MFGAVLPLSPYPNHAMIVLYITSTIFPYRHLITTPSSWLLQLPSSFYQFYSSLQFYGSLPQPCSLKTPSPSSPSSPSLSYSGCLLRSNASTISFSYSPAPRLWLSQYKFLLPLAYAYTFNDPLSIHFSLVPVLQVPTITSLAYFPTSPRLCLQSYSSSSSSLPSTTPFPSTSPRLCLQSYFYQWLRLRLLTVIKEDRKRKLSSVIEPLLLLLLLIVSKLQDP